MSKKQKRLERNLQLLVQGLRDSLDLHKSMDVRINGLAEHLALLDYRLRQVETCPEERTLH